MQPTRLPPPSSPALLPVLAAAVFIGMLVAVWGILSVLLDRDVVDYPDAGPVLGPAMVVAAAIVTWLVALRTASVPRLVGPLVALAVVAVVMPLVGAIGMTITRGDLTWMPTAFVHFAISPFMLAAAVLAGATVALFRALARERR